MIKEEIAIEFNELCASEIIKDEEFVSIVKDDNITRYKIVNTEEELLKHSLNPIEHLEEKVGILVTCKCNNIYGSFYDAIFLEKFKIDSYAEPKIEDHINLSFNNCEFFQSVELLGGDYRRIKINDSILRKNLFLRFINCEKLMINNVKVEEDATLENSEIGIFNVNTTKFQESLIFQEVKILNAFTLDKVKVNKDLGFIDCSFEGLSKLELDINGELNFTQCSFYKKSEINFDEMNGKFSLYKTNFSDNCYLEYELLENKKYKPLIFEDDFKKTKWNFLIVSDIYKSSGRTEQYLETLFYFKKYERLERRHIKGNKFSLLDYLIEISTKYYTSWKRTLVSMGFIIGAFFILYCCFPNLLMCGDTELSSKNLFVTMFEMIQTSTFDINFFISKIGNALYFTIITFTTVGYGDITPLYWMKLAVGLEAFLGVFFTSSFVVALSKKFL